MRTSRKILLLVSALVAGAFAVVILNSRNSNTATRQAPSQPVSSTQAPPAEEELASLAAKQLAAMLSGEGMDASAEAGTIRMATRSLSLTTRVDQVVEQDGRFIAALHFFCRVDGAPMESLHSGSIGVDTRRDSALRTAVEEWVAQYGRAIGLALVNPKREEAMAVGEFLVYRGLTGVRGEAPPGFNPDKAFHARVLEHLEPVLRERYSNEPGSLHALTLMLMVGEGQAQGECRTDGVEAPQLCARAASFAWPQGTEAYMFKQYYVLVPAQARGR